jgi:DNA-binding HxlR family transcriptional regulator
MQVSHQILTNPVARGLNVLGDRWTILIMRDAFLGRHRFSEFREHTGIARGTLTNRLESLVEQGLMYKKPYSTSPLRHEYRLTQDGLALYPWALLIWQWEADWADQADAGVPLVLRHKVGEEHDLVPACVCRHCRQPFHYDDVERVEADINDQLKVSETALRKEMGSQRRTRTAKVSRDADQSLSHVVDIIGDRWTTLILAAAFLGLQRYDDIQQQLGIATNILAERLKMLVQMGVLTRREYQSTPPRSQYELTEKGKSLYPQTLAIRQWALDHLPPVPHPYKLVHRSCGADLAIDVICKTCGEVPTVGEVEFEAP